MKLEIRKLFADDGGGYSDIKINYDTVDAACKTIDTCLTTITELCNQGISVTSYQGQATSEIETWLDNLKSDLNSASNSKMNDIRSNLDTVRKAYLEWESSTQSAFRTANAKHASSSATGASGTGTSTNMVQ